MEAKTNELTDNLENRRWISPAFPASPGLGLAIGAEEAQEASGTSWKQASIRLVHELKPLQAPGERGDCDDLASHSFIALFRRFFRVPGIPSARAAPLCYAH